MQRIRSCGGKPSRGTSHCPIVPHNAHPPPPPPPCPHTVREAVAISVCHILWYSILRFWRDLPVTLLRKVWIYFAQYIPLVWFLEYMFNKMFPPGELFSTFATFREHSLLSRNLSMFFLYL